MTAKIRAFEHLVLGIILIIILMTSSVSSSSSSNAQQPLLTNQVPFMDRHPSFLFLGNSYTHSNNLPALFQSLVEHDAASGIIKPEWSGQVKVERRDPGGESFAGHLQQLDGSRGLQTQLRQWLVHPETRQNWNWVCLQDQSQLPGFFGLGGQGGQEYKSSLVAAGKIDKDYVQPNGAQTVFFQTWGRRDRDDRNPGMYPNFLTMQNLLTEGYRRYWKATTTKDRPTYIAPVGLVFETIYKDIAKIGEDPTSRGTLFYDLYVSDGSHPSLAGSYLAALTLYVTLTGKNPKVETWCHPQLGMELCVKIQDAVHRTILETYTFGTIDYPWQLLQPQKADLGTRHSEL